MPDLSLDLRNLRCALAVVEQGSFRQAALELELPQSTVSRRVAQLEHTLGISIFSRGHQGVRLTTAGQRFMKEALIGARHFANAVGAMRAMRQGEAGRLHLGLYTSLRNEALKGLVNEYHRRHPAIDCHFEEGNAQALVSGVLDGRLDIAFVTGRPRTPRCEATVLGDEHLYAAQPKSRVRDSIEQVDLLTLRDQRFIVTKGGRGPDIEDFLISRLSSPGFRPHIQVHDVSFETLLHMVELGFGTAVVSQGAASRDGPIAFRALSGPASKVVTSAIWLTSNANPALGPFVKLARRILGRRVNSAS